MRAAAALIAIMILVLLAACSSGDAHQTASVSVEPQEAAEPTGEISEAVLKSPTAKTDSLVGELYYLALAGEKQQLLKLDLASSDEELIFAVPELGWLSGAAVSPDGQQIVLSYSAPPEEGQVQFGFTDLYLMPADGSQDPVPLITKEDPSEAFFNISWPVEDTIYYAHVAPSADDDGIVSYSSQVERISPDGTNREVLASTAAWPRLAPDGSKLSYVNDDLELIISQADGSNAEVVLDAESFEAVDAPLFPAGRDEVCFSAVNPQPQSALSMWERLLGVRRVRAHSVPSDWYCLSLDSGELVQLTDLNALGLYGDFNPEATHLAFISTDGVYILAADGSDLQKLKDASAFGTLNWLP